MFVHVFIVFCLPFPFVWRFYRHTSTTWCVIPANASNNERITERKKRKKKLQQFHISKRKTDKSFLVILICAFAVLYSTYDKDFNISKAHQWINVTKRHHVTKTFLIGQIFSSFYINMMNEWMLFNFTHHNDFTF